MYRLAYPINNQTNKNTIKEIEQALQDVTTRRCILLFFCGFICKSTCRICSSLAGKQFKFIQAIYYCCAFRQRTYILYLSTYNAKTLFCLYIRFYEFVYFLSAFNRIKITLFKISVAQNFQTFNNL